MKRVGRKGNDTIDKKFGFPRLTTATHAAALAPVTHVGALWSCSCQHMVVGK